MNSATSELLLDPATLVTHVSTPLGIRTERLRRLLDVASSMPNASTKVRRPRLGVAIWSLGARDVAVSVCNRSSRRLDKMTLPLPVAGPGTDVDDPVRRADSRRLPCRSSRGADAVRRREPAGRDGSELDCDLVDLIYILDDPTVGLHPRDIGHLIAMLHRWHSTRPPMVQPPASSTAPAPALSRTPPQSGHTRSVTAADTPPCPRRDLVLVLVDVQPLGFADRLRGTVSRT